MIYPVLAASRRLDPHPMSRQYAQGALEGYLSAQTSHRCLRPWHLDALAKCMEYDADAVVRQVLADETILRLNPSSMPGVYSLHGDIGYTTVQALQELAANTRLHSGDRATVASYLTSAGHPGHRDERTHRGRRGRLPPRPPVGIPQRTGA